jgi:hypothetical protein
MPDIVADDQGLVEENIFGVLWGSLKIRLGPVEAGWRHRPAGAAGLETRCRTGVLPHFALKTAPQVLP